MRGLTVFHLQNCPYCRNAKKALEELCAEKPEYAGISLDWIEESKEPERTMGYDYYYVPTFFLGKEKLYEAKPGETYEECKALVKSCLDKALA